MTLNLLRAQQFQTRLFDRIIKGEPNECWTWDTESKANPPSRPTVGLGHWVHPHPDYPYSMTNAARALCFAANGYRSLGNAHVHHTCENPFCMNPSHLEVIDPVVHGTMHALSRYGDSPKAVQWRELCRKNASSQNRKDMRP